MDDYERPGQDQRPSLWPATSSNLKSFRFSKILSSIPDPAALKVFLQMHEDLFSKGPIQLKLWRTLVVPSPNYISRQYSSFLSVKPRVVDKMESSLLEDLAQAPLSLDSYPSPLYPSPGADLEV